MVIHGDSWWYKLQRTQTHQYFTISKTLNIENINIKTLNSLSANPTEWSNTLKQFVGF